MQNSTSDLSHQQRSIGN